MAPGTPGYVNNAQKDKPADINGEVVLSEIMYDSVPTATSCSGLKSTTRQ